MPTRADILSGLAFIANDALTLAMAWHVGVLAVVVALAAGWRPYRRWAGVLLTLPLVSTAVLAGLYRNPFNALVVGLLAVVLAILALRLGSGRVERGPVWSALVGAGLIFFAWSYPHFLDPSKPAIAYLFASPMGLVPCPSLALVVGFGLLAGGLGSRAWSIGLAMGALFYGLFGTIRLGVYIDMFLLCGAVALLVSGRSTRQMPAS